MRGLIKFYLLPCGSSEPVENKTKESANGSQNGTWVILTKARLEGMSFFLRASVAAAAKSLSCSRLPVIRGMSAVLLSKYPDLNYSRYK